MTQQHMVTVNILLYGCRFSPVMICHLPGLWQQCTDRKRVLAKTTGKEKSHKWPNGIRHVPRVPRSGTSYGLVSPYRLYLFRRFAVCFHWSSNCEVHKLWSVVYLNHNKSNSSNSHGLWVCDFYGSQAYSNSLKVVWTSLKVNQSTCASTEKKRIWYRKKTCKQLSKYKYHIVWNNLHI